MIINIDMIHNGVSFGYIYDQGEFNFSIESSLFGDFNHDALLRVALCSRPANSTNYKVNGIMPSVSLLSYFRRNLNSEIIVSDAINVVYSRLDEFSFDQLFLAFSGGFDSIAAYALLERKPKLVSMSFGEAFQREEMFFQSFNPIVMKSNIRNSAKKFNESVDWRFMISPISMLANKTLGDNVFISTGAILEASDYSFRSDVVSIFNGYGGDDLGSGAILISPVSSISEYGTTLIANNFLAAQDFDKSLESLAPVSSFKNYRKRVLRAIIEEQPIPNLPSNIKPHSLGRGFTDDVLAIYFCWKLGASWVSKNYVENFSPRISKYDMSFFEKSNPSNITFDNKLKSYIIDRLSFYGIDQYNEDDVDSISRVRDFLLKSNF